MIKIPTSLENLKPAQIKEILEAVPSTQEEYLAQEQFKNLVIKSNCKKVMANIFGEQHTIVRYENLLEEICQQLITLTPNELAVVVYRYGLNVQDPCVHTLKETAEHFSAEKPVSVENVRQIEAKAFRKLRHPSRSRNLIKFFMTDEQLKEQEIARQKHSEEKAKAEEEYKERIKNGDYSLVTVEELDISTRAYNCLKRSGIHTVQTLTTKTKQDLREIRNLGAGCAEEISDALDQQFGIVLAETPADERI